MKLQSVDETEDEMYIWKKHFSLMTGWLVWCNALACEWKKTSIKSKCSRKEQIEHCKNKCEMCSEEAIKECEMDVAAERERERKTFWR